MQITDFLFIKLLPGFSRGYLKNKAKRKDPSLFFIPTKINNQICTFPVHQINL